MNLLGSKKILANTLYAKKAGFGGFGALVVWFWISGAEKVFG